MGKISTSTENHILLYIYGTIIHNIEFYVLLMLLIKLTVSYFDTNPGIILSINYLKR